MDELPFVGDERHALVDQLLEAFDAVVEAGSPRLVTLEAVSGWGKTRVVQELYRRLAAERQSPPGYWPPSIQATASDATDTSGRPQERRKRVHPQVFTPPEGSTPEWLWWGISATARRTGSAVQALAMDLAQIDAHADALERRWRQVSGRKERLGQVLKRDEARSLGDAATQQAVSTGLEKLIEASVPGLGFLWWAGQLTWAQRHRWSGERKPTSQIDATGGDTDLVTGVAASLGHFAAAGIPVVIMVEDAHEADASLIDLLVRTLGERHGPILIVATAWPGFLDDPAVHAHRLLSEVDAPARIRLRPSDLDDLAVDDRAELVTQLRPGVHGAVRTALASRYPNPYALELVCQLERVTDLIEDGELTVAEVARLPRDVEGLYEEMWASLPDELRDALMLAVLATPDAVSDLFSERTWDAGRVAATWAALDWLQDRVDELATQLSERGGVYAWARSIDEWLQSCHEPAQHHVASKEANDRYTPSRRYRYYRSLAEQLDPADVDLTPARRRVQAQLLTALAVEGHCPWTDEVVDAADTLLDEAAEGHDTDSLRTVIDLGAAIPDRAGPRDLERRYQVATALGRSGRRDAAIEQLTQLLAEQQDRLDSDHPLTLRTRNDLAAWTGRSGRVDDAIEQFTQVVEDRVRVLGPDHEDTLRTRSNLASWLAKDGRTGATVAEFTRLLEDRTRVLGPDHPDTLRTRSNLATWRARSGDTHDTVDRFTRLLEDRTRVLGPDHPDTLRTRSNLATWIGRDGYADDAVTRFEALVEDRARVLGRDHPDTLRTRRKLARWLEQAERYPEAIDQLDRLQEDQRRILGSDHPDLQATHKSRMRLRNRMQEES